MATWHIEPYQLNEPFIPDNKWILNRKDEEGDNSPMSEFAELNVAVLEIIHNEKRFPTKNEMLKIRHDQRENALVKLFFILNQYQFSLVYNTDSICQRFGFFKIMGSKNYSLPVSL